MRRDTVHRDVAELAPPWAPEAEASVLGAVLAKPDELPAILDVVHEAMFHRESHRRVFRAYVRLFERGEEIDPVTVYEELQAVGDAEAVGGVPFLSELMDANMFAVNVAGHARIIRERWQLRKLIEASQQTIQDVHDPQDRSAAELIDVAGQRIHQLAQDQVGKGFVSLHDLIMPTFEDLELRQKAGVTGITGLPSGLADLDMKTGGWQKSDLIIVAARPSMGKTALVTGFALHAAVRERTPVAFFSLEQSAQQLVQRSLCHVGLVDLGSLLRGKLADDDYVRLASAASQLNTAPIFIDDTAAISVLDLRARLRRLMAEHEIGLVVVDYIQRMKGTGENRTQEIGGISRGLKSVAKEFEVPLIALSQLSRAPDARPDHRPRLSDLRESGDIEQDADLVVFVYRPEQYLTAAEVREKGVQGQAELILAKHRNGPTGSVDAYFRASSARFETMAREPELIR